MSRTWNQFVVKQENKAIVLNTIIKQTPISRAKVAEQTGLNKGTVSSLVSELIDADFVKESGPGASSGGRRPVMLLFNHEAGFAVVVDLGVGYIQVALTDLHGEVVIEEQEKTGDYSFDVVLKQLTVLINRVIKKAPKSPYGIIGIGVGVPAVVSHDGEILLAPNLNWKRVQLKEALSEHFDYPIFIENEANAGAYGEMRYGFTSAPSNMLYLSIGMGIGMGMILNGKLYTGQRGFAGEVGHISIVKDGIPCRCGNIGCFERYASVQALLEQAAKRGLAKGDQQTALNTLIRKAEENDEKVIALFKEIATYIGIGISSIVNLYNPESVIIGNAFTGLEKWIKPVIDNHVKQHTIGFHQEDLTVDFAKLVNHSTIKGMAAFTIESFLNTLKEQ